MQTAYKRVRAAELQAHTEAFLALEPSCPHPKICNGPDLAVFLKDTYGASCTETVHMIS